MYEVRVGDNVFEKCAVLDTAIERAKYASKTFAGVHVLWVDRAERIVRAFADNGRITWASACKACAPKKVKGCEHCVLGYVKERV